MVSEMAVKQSAHDRMLDATSPWVARWIGLIAPRSNVLDVACGHGRHSRLLAAQGHQVTAVDFDVQALAILHDVPGITTLAANLEHAPWPFADRQFGAIIVTNYLHRPLLAKLADALAPGGVLLYETFMQGNEHYGRGLATCGSRATALRGRPAVSLAAAVERLSPQRVPAIPAKKH